MARATMPALRGLGTTLAFGAGALALIMGGGLAACQSTDEPRAGTPRPGASSGQASSGGASSSGGVDAALPAEPLDCGPAPAGAGPFTKQALIGAVADCSAWQACTFVNTANALRTAVSTHVAQPDDASLAGARSAWAKAMDDWSRAEVFQFGPLGSTVTDPYWGRSLRSFVHPWPQTSRCEVEKQVAGKSWKTDGIGTVLPAGRGLFALEYLLYYPGADTACLAGSPTGQTWATLSPSDLAAAKREYEVATAENLVAIALEHHGVWRSDGESFKQKLLAHEKYGSEQETLNVIAWAMFYIEQEVKDVKLASRAGVQATPPVPETPFALVEAENVRTNLRAFRSLFQGCGDGGAGLGFDDWLVAAGHETLSNDILASLASAQAAADAFPSFEQATTAQFLALYEAVRPLSNILKTNLFGSASPLNLRLPASAASDTD